MLMTTVQRVIIALTAAAVVLQLLLPPTYFSGRPDLPATVLRVLAIVIAGGTIFWLNPGRKVLVPTAVVVGAGGALIGSLALWHALTPLSPPAQLVPSTPQTGTVESPTPSTSVSQGIGSFLPPAPTLSELADSAIVSQASIVLNFWVDSQHQTFQELHANDKDTLCAAGKAIRDSMKAHRNTLADLNHVERAIYDITAPAERCH